MQHIRRFTAFVVLMIASLSTAAAFPWQIEGSRSPSPKKEKELLDVLRSDAAKAKKADACKDLAVYGSSAAVPDLARLLADEQLASWARIALEAIPGPAADEALRNSIGSLQGKLLIGAVNSIGVRRDAKAAANLAEKLRDKNADVASAAAVALGRIGNADAAKSLQETLAAAPKKVRSAAAEGLVLCAERSLNEGRAAQAAQIYDLLRNADVPKQRILEATRGAILARGDDGIPLLLEQLRSSDKRLFQVALGVAREFPGRQVDQALAAEIDRAAPERAALVIGAMADRKETVVLAALLKAAGSGPRPVRLAAVRALGRVGDASCLPPLLDLALAEDVELARSAKSALFELPGRDVDQDVVTRLRGAQGRSYPLLIEVVGERRIKAVDDLVKALDSSENAVRFAALKSLGTTVPAERLSVLIAEVVAPKYADDAPAAERALKAASVRMPDREACAKELAAALERAPAPTKIALLKILGAVGGTRALASVGAAAKGSEPDLQNVSIQLLGAWMTIDAAPVLLDLANSDIGDKFRIRALRGYIRMARQFAMPDPERSAMCQKAVEAAIRPDEQKLVLEILKIGRYRNLGSLRLAAKMLAEIPGLNKEATDATVVIARELGDEKHSDTADEVRHILSRAQLAKVKLEIVKAEYGAGAKQKDVTQTLQKQAADVQYVALPSPSYSASFGGDPAPGTVKQLKIQYRINGKPGDASFAENAVIVLPTPK